MANVHASGSAVTTRKADAAGPLLTRRAAALATMGAAVVASGWHGSAIAGSGLSVGEVIDRVRRHHGAAWRDDAGDVLLSGDRHTIATGIAVTIMPDMVALRKAVASGCNMIVSLESPFYARPSLDPETSGSSLLDGGGKALRESPTYAAKLACITENNLAILRLDANLHDARSQPLIDAVGATMGWRGDRDPDDPGIYTLPQTSLGALARSVKRRLGLNGGMRVIGSATMPLTRVLVAPGRIDPVAVVKVLPRVDVLLAGDLREWELVEYLADSWRTASPKALIAVGRVLSEQPGMLATAGWLRAATGLPVHPLAVEDPYWRLPA